ncbi:MAG: hypothetical protein QOF75_2347 [Gaiellaceae bacterium]|nr:hypothetical protein [Gaiellaceae bacterium]
MIPPLLATAAVFGTAHIAATAAITGAVALVASLLLLGGRGGLFESLAIAVLSVGAVFLWRKSANMPQLNNDGLSPFSANDWLAPTLTWVVLGMYASVRRPGNDRRFAQARTIAVLAAFAVNVVTI